MPYAIAIGNRRSHISSALERSSREELLRVPHLSRTPEEESKKVRRKEKTRVIAGWKGRDATSNQIIKIFVENPSSAVFKTRVTIVIPRLIFREQRPKDLLRQASTINIYAMTFLLLIAHIIQIWDNVESGGEWGLLLLVVLQYE